MNTSDSHYIYWPESHKVSVERNILFLTWEQVKYVPIISTGENKPIYKKLPEYDYSNVPLLASPIESDKTADEKSKGRNKTELELEIFNQCKKK
jgi:hypothetical protein